MNKFSSSKIFLCAIFLSLAFSCGHEPNNPCDVTGNYDREKCLESQKCVDKCTLGAKQCSGNGYQICGNTDVNPCLDWGEVTTCGVGEVCIGGDCIPNPADTGKIAVNQNPPGTADTISGSPGAVEGSAWVIVYSDSALTQEIGRVQANADGSFSAINIGDNQYGTVYIIAENAAGKKSDSISVANDITPPDTSIVSKPSSPINQPSATFDFASTESGSAFECQIDSGGWQACISPQSYNVLSEGSHTFSARAKDPAGNVDPTPASYLWTVTPPETNITSQPFNPTNQTSASFTFTSDEVDSTFKCQIDSGGYSSCISPTTYSGLSGGAGASHTFQVYAVDPAGNADPTPASYTWTIDTQAPDTSISSYPQNPTISTSATFTFTSTENGSTFECQIDGGGYSSCASPKTYIGLTGGAGASHTFQVYSIDLVGNADPTPASYAWTIDTKAPDTSIRSYPQNPTNTTSAIFTFISTEAGSTFKCQMDSCGYSSCTSPKAYPGLTSGAGTSHTFQVYAVDPAGNADPTPASYSWMIDTQLPNSSITSQPSDPTKSTSATFNFTSTEAGSTFMCQIDSGGYSACIIPKNYSGLTGGAGTSHTFQVYSVDPAGNADSSPASYTWTIDTQAPDTSIGSYPQNPTNSASAIFTFTSTEAGSTFECQIDSGGYSSFTSPMSYTGLSEGSHTFYVRAKDLAGNVDSTPAFYSWTINFGSWTSTSTGTNVPSGRRFHTAVWTGSEMIIWGGADCAGSGCSLNSGGRYNPSTDSWTATSTGANVPSARESHTAVWTGSKMIIWGGYYTDVSTHYLNTGGRYSPSTDSWTTTGTGANVPTGREAHTAVWTDSEMIVWGGVDASNNLDTGGRYNPSTDSWTPTSTGTNVPSGRVNHTAVWTGTEMIVWGGYYYDGSGHYVNTGGRYNPSTNSWTSTSTGANVPTGRSVHTAVWTGSEMIIWGGGTNTGGRYNPSTDSWTSTSTGANVPTGRSFHTAVWIDFEMIIWGGGSSNPVNTGGRYNLYTNSWTPTSTGTNVPLGRWFHTAVWTGSEMIVWGGQDNSANWLNTGGKYNPNP
jgi:hypothetical protein